MEARGILGEEPAGGGEAALPGEGEAVEVARRAGEGEDVACPLFQPEGTYETRALLEWVEAQAQGIAAKFDARNGTPKYQKLLERGRSLVNEVRPFPIDAA